VNAPRVIAAYRKKIDRALEHCVAQRLENLPTFGSRIVRLEHELIARACLVAGKRLRPTMTIMAYRAVGGRNEKKIFEAALAFELFHAYTLVHDDVYDEDAVRRGQPSFHARLAAWYRQHGADANVPATLYRDRATRFGVIGGVLGGEALHNLCIDAILGAPVSAERRIEGLRIYAAAAPADNGCQLFDLALETEPLSEKKYMALARYKSGKLMAAAVEWGAVLGSGTASQRAALREYAECLGQAFQIKDDILDMDVSGKKPGRPVRRSARLSRPSGAREASPMARKLRVALQQKALQPSAARDQRCGRKNASFSSSLPSSSLIEKPSLL
jgi:geranylgeranyl pyrophosphate synthase